MTGPLETRTTRRAADAALVPAIELSGLSKRYRDLTAVDDVTLSVPAGTVLGLLGPNGAGKTTTIKMIAGLIVPSAGTVRLNGYDVARHRSHAVRQSGAVLPAADHLAADLHSSASEITVAVGDLHERGAIRVRGARRRERRNESRVSATTSKVAAASSRRSEARYLRSRPDAALVPATADAPLAHLGLRLAGASDRVDRCRVVRPSCGRHPRRGRSRCRWGPTSLVEAMGVETGISKSEVSRICAGLDEASARSAPAPSGTGSCPPSTSTRLASTSATCQVVAMAVVVATGIAAVGSREIGLPRFGGIAGPHLRLAAPR